MSSPKRAVLFFLGGIDAIDAIEDMSFWGCELGGMEENKKSGGWDVRASKSPSEMAYRGQLHASEAQASAAWR